MTGGVSGTPSGAWCFGEPHVAAAGPVERASIRLPRTERGPGRGSGVGWEWISNYKSKEIHGNNYRKMDLKENKPFPPSHGTSRREELGH